MGAKIFGTTMLILNILMVCYAMMTPDEAQLFLVIFYIAETFLSIKYLESLKDK